MMKNKFRWLLRPTLFTLAITSLIVFQNCGRVQLSETSQIQEFSSEDRATDIQFKEVVILVDVNETKTVDLLNSTEFKGTISFENGDASVKTFSDDNASITLSSTNAGEVTFVPTYGFRGTVSKVLYLKYSDQKQEAIKLIFQVRNPLADFKPALISRSTSCILCHAQIKGDLVTDYGFKSSLDPQGPDLFFRQDQRAYNVTHDPNPNNGLIASTLEGQLVVPKVNFADLPANPARVFQYGPGPATTLAEYLQQLIFPQMAVKPLGLVEKSQIYIGAPSADDIRQRGKLNSTTVLRYVKNSTTSPELSGLTRVVKPDLGFDYHTNSASEVLVCEGDVFIDGVVWLNNLKVQTEEGCRLHATGSVFISGPIEYVDESALTNLQIMSARGIYMGFGMCFDCYPADPNVEDYGVNWIRQRYSTMAGHMTSFRRDSVSDQLAAVLEDFRKISMEASVPRPSSVETDVKAYFKTKLADANVNLVDAANYYDDQSNISYERLLLNAPDIQSRYIGNFRGTIIAEFSMWRLGQFHFKYDPVFKAVPIFPLMNFSQIIRIEN